MAGRIGEYKKEEVRTCNVVARGSRPGVHDVADRGSDPIVSGAPCAADDVEGVLRVLSLAFK